MIHTQRVYLIIAHILQFDERLKIAYLQSTFHEFLSIAHPYSIYFKVHRMSAVNQFDRHDDGVDIFSMMSECERS